MIRLLQNFSSIELDLTAQPTDSLAPPEWAEGEGRRAKEELRVKSHFTLFAKVCVLARSECIDKQLKRLHRNSTGWLLGEDGCGRNRRRCVKF